MVAREVCVPNQILTEVEGFAFGSVDERYIMIFQLQSS